MSGRAPIEASGDLFSLDGVRAAVTGSSRGIGLAIARVLLALGARVLVNGYDAEETQRALESLREQFPTQDDARTRVAGLAGDVTERVIVDGLIAEAVRVFGDVDHLVCNAGIDIIK